MELTALPAHSTHSCDETTQYSRTLFGGESNIIRYQKQGHLSKVSALLMIRERSRIGVWHGISSRGICCVAIQIILRLGLLVYTYP